MSETQRHAAVPLGAGDYEPPSVGEAVAVRLVEIFGVGEAQRIAQSCLASPTHSDQEREVWETAAKQIGRMRTASRLS